MRSQVPDLSVLTDRDCLITFAAMALCCDNTVRDHEMGYHQGGGTAYITAKGLMRRTGLSRTAAEYALGRLETAGVAKPAPDSTGWRTSADTLTAPPPADDYDTPDQHHGMPSAQTPDIDAAHLHDFRLLTRSKRRSLACRFT